jgi:hypothetical protein
MRVFLYMKHSASSHDPLKASNEDANLIRRERLTLLLVPDAACLVLRVLYRPGGGRMNGDRRVLVGIHPCELEFRFASCNV